METDSIWGTLLNKGVDIAGDIIGAKFGVGGGNTAQPASNNPQLIGTGASTGAGGIPSSLILAGVGVAAVAGVILLVTLMKR